MIEIWKRLIYHNEDLGDYYLVSNTGKIKGVKTGRIRKSNINHEGYYIVSISLGSRENKRTIKIHRAVAETFISKVDGKDFVNHIDGNKLNNHISNLEWCTASENTYHAIQHNLKVYVNKQIKCLETNEIFNSIELAAQWCNCKQGTIKDYLYRKDKHRNYAGKHPITNENLHWCYVS